MNLRKSIFILLILMMIPLHAYGYAEACIDLLSKKHNQYKPKCGMAGLAQLICLLYLPIMVVSEPIIEPVYAYSGDRHYLGFEKEIDIFIKEIKSADKRVSNLLVFLTPQFLIDLSGQKHHRLKLRFGFHYEFIFGNMTGPRQVNGKFGFTTGIGVSLGGEFKNSYLFAMGPDIKFFYHFVSMRLTRFIIGARYERGNLGHELTCYLGLSLAF